MAGLLFLTSPPLFLLWLIHALNPPSIWHPTPVLLPGKSHGRRSLESCNPWDRWGSGMTEQLHFHALEKEMATHSSVLAWIPGTGELWWAAIYRVAQSRTRLKWLSLSLYARGWHVQPLPVLEAQFLCPRVTVSCLLFLVEWSVSSTQPFHFGQLYLWIVYSWSW